MIGYMRRGCFMIASHMSELAEEVLNYHRDDTRSCGCATI
jgi:hypothetical protein